MANMTITEGLAEVKTIGNRIKKKQEAIVRYFSRDAKLRDPLEKDGGSHEFIRKERQSISDLENRIVKIRSSIQKVNNTTNLAVAGTTKTVQEWLNWRKEISGQKKMFLSEMAKLLNQIRQNALRQGMSVTDKSSGEYAPTEVVVSINEQELAKEIEGLEETLGSLDGKLSLLNATTTIEVD